MKYTFTQANVSLNDLHNFGPTMTSAELPILQFSTQLGYFKTLSLGKLMCHKAHTLTLVSGDC